MTKTLPYAFTSFVWEHLNAVFCERRWKTREVSEDPDKQQTIEKLEALDRRIHAEALIRLNKHPEMRRAFERLADDEESVELLRSLSEDLTYE